MKCKRCGRENVRMITHLDGEGNEVQAYYYEPHIAPSAEETP